jgi:hypothetical protein
MTIFLSVVDGMYILEVERGKTLISIEAESPEDLRYQASYNFSQQTLDRIEKRLQRLLMDLE